MPKLNKVKSKKVVNEEEKVALKDLLFITNKVNKVVDECDSLINNVFSSLDEVFKKLYDNFIIASFNKLSSGVDRKINKLPKRDKKGRFVKSNKTK